MRPAVSQRKWLVYATRPRPRRRSGAKPETGAERWLISPVTRDDQESRASRDTLPRYDAMPDGQSWSCRSAASQRVDLATGEARVIPFTAKVQAEIAPRVYTPVRADDGEKVRARLIRWPVPSPDGRRLVFSAMNHLYTMDLPGGTPRRVTSSTEGEFMPTWSPDGRQIAYVTWTDRGGHIKRVDATGGQPATLTSFEGYYLDPAYTPDGSRIVFISGAATDQLYSIMLGTPADPDDPDAPSEIGGVDPPNTLELKSIPAAGGAATFIAAAQGGRAPHFTNRDPKRVFLTSNRGLQSITLDGYDRRTCCG